MSIATTPTSFGFSGRNFKTVRFYTTKYVLNLTRALSQMLLRELKILTADIVCDALVTSETVQRNRTNPTELLFILIPQLLVADIGAVPEPGKYCIYQLEQMNDKNVANETLIKTHFNSILTSLIRNSVAAFDYSSVNLDYYPESLRSKITLLPPPIYITPAIPSRRIHFSDTRRRDDILFYGSVNARRERIVDQLAQTLNRRGYKYNIRVLTRSFGDELMDYISGARIVLNIHFYANSILETDRIHTALQFDNVTVISEYPTQRDALLPIYESFPQIKFCNEIGSDAYNVDELADACIRAIAGSDDDDGVARAAAHLRTVNQLNALCGAHLIPMEK